MHIIVLSDSKNRVRYLESIQTVKNSQNRASDILSFLIVFDSRFDSSNEFWLPYVSIDNRVDFLIRSIIRRYYLDFSLKNSSEFLTLT